jgi:hypothetical protein
MNLEGIDFTSLSCDTPKEFEMEPIVQEMRDTSGEMGHLADIHIQAKTGHRLVDVANREKAVNLLKKFQETYPSKLEHSVGFPNRYVSVRVPERSPSPLPIETIHRPQ